MGTLTCHPDPEMNDVGRGLDFDDDDDDFEDEDTNFGSVSNPGDDAMPLAFLSTLLTVGPPSIGDLLNKLQGGEWLQQFAELVNEYLPEHRQEIMRGAPIDRATAFRRLFGEKYFELDLDNITMTDDPIIEITHAIPVNLQGLGYEDYHEFEYMHDSMILLLSLVESPWLEPWDDEDGARIPLLDKVSQLLGEEIAQLIPKEGWSPEALHSRLNGTKYEQVASFADWVWHQTGLVLLDTDWETSGCGFGAQMLDWDMELVETLTVQRPLIQEFWDNLNRFGDWLMSDHVANFKDLLYFMLGKQAFQVPKEQLRLPLDIPEKPKTLYEIFSKEVQGEETPGWFAGGMADDKEIREFMTDVRGDKAYDRLSREISKDDILDANNF